eukprot:gnl/TRDRNA2_/TRDRNA2_57023_c0_seq2.p1 gnl/TRDRNA2_/TRDRNA2_57023_c0~~gnl/TRDRNA2_/TRDRNA2_57023_c0_seq2.p1  ORF type:complete len:152 (+),score=40.55 gnl/TRDRNA2_/TRDRNA2_57023_c0_seq2:137-592(+)
MIPAMRSAALLVLTSALAASKSLIKDSISIENGADDFEEKVTKADKLTVVCFHKADCPHCQEYRPTLEKIAVYLNKSPDSVAQMADVDCQAKVNRPVCKAQGTFGRQYPILKYYEPDGSSGDIPDHVREFNKVKKFVNFLHKEMKKKKKEL